VNDWEDDDRDGFPDAACDAERSDCDDLDPDVYPGAPRRCDGQANDCTEERTSDAEDTAWYPDEDGDGWGAEDAEAIMACVRPAATSNRAGDCDDSAEGVHPNAIDGCDGVDSDCDEMIDEDAFVTPYYEDLDGDGYGSTVVTLACEKPDELIARPGDCDDRYERINPAAPELCDGSDRDCDGAVDEGEAASLCPEAGGGDIACTSGACTVVECTEPFADCNGLGIDGCEADLASDPMNCGGCEIVCGGDSPQCVDGGCVI
jgi:hypothetical protein